MMTNLKHGSIAHFDVAGADAGVLSGFYATLFNWTMDPKGPGYTLVKTSEGSPNGAIMESEAPSLRMGVTVTDLADTLVKAQMSGGTVIMPITDNGWVKKAQISDPSGNVVTLIEL